MKLMRPPQAASKHMGAGSRIVLLSTSLAHMSGVQPAHLVYVATKGAIEQATRALSKELFGRSISCHTQRTDASQPFTTLATYHVCSRWKTPHVHGRLL